MAEIDSTIDVNVQTRYFYAWWMYILPEGVEPQTRPLYRVCVSSPAELAVARSVQPDIVDAEYFLNGERVESPQLETA